MAVLAAFLFAGKHLLVLLVLAATSWVAGRLVLRRLELGSAAERFAVPAALGLTILGHAFLVLGFCGLLTRWAVAGVVVAVHVLGWREVRRPARSPGWIAGGVGALAPFFVLSLFPPVAFDETLYHLPFARAFAATGGVPYLPELRAPVFPQLQEILQTAVLLQAGDVATHLVQLLGVILTAALLVGWGRRLGGAAWGWLAAGLYLGSPIVAHLAATGYVEAGLALFGTAAIYSWYRWTLAGAGAEARGWLLLAGVFAGSAGGVKYLGLYFVGIVLLAVLGTAAPERRWRPVLLAGLAALVVLAPWYGRILYYTGNPLFPFFPSLFPTPGAWEFGGVLPPRTLEERIVSFVRLPWDVVLHRSAVGSQPPFSPAFLLGLPLLILAAVREARVRWLLAAVIGYAVIFLLLPPDARYLVAVLPLLSLALAGAVARWAPSRLAAILAIVLFLPGWLYAGYRVWVQGPVPVTAGAREAWLARQLPVYPAIRFLNRAHGGRYTVYALHAENLIYYADGRFLGDWNGPARFGRVVPLLRQPEALWLELRRLGADHLLVVQGVGVPPPVDDPAFRRRFRRVYFDGAAEVFRLTLTP